MKKRILLVTLVGAFSYLVFSSNKGGAAATSPFTNCTGAVGSVALCSGSGTGCHGASGQTSVGLYVYSALNFSTTVDTVLPGQPYNIVILGSNGTLSTHLYGYQACAVSGTGASQVQAGVWSTLPFHVDSIPFPASSPVFDIIENDSTLVASSTLPSGTFHDTLYWNAPDLTAASGPIHFYCTELAVNGNGLADVADVSGNAAITVYFNANVSVKSISENTIITTSPNPCNSQFVLQMNHADAGSYTLKAYDMSGKNVLNEKVQVSNNTFETNINTSNWTAGFYGLQVLNKDGAQRFIPIIKQ